MVPIDEIFALTLREFTDTFMIINEIVEDDLGVVEYHNITNVPVAAAVWVSP